MHASLSRSALLRKRMRSLISVENGAVADFLLELREYDRDKLYLGDGFSSLFDYCLRELGLSKASSYRRMVCARMLGRFPQIEPFLRDGRMNLTNLALLKDVLSVENVDALLARAAGRSTEEVEHIVACLRPRPALRDCVRRVAVAAESSMVSSSEGFPAETSSWVGASSAGASSVGASSAGASSAGASSAGASSIASSQSIIAPVASAPAAEPHLEDAGARDAASETASAARLGRDRMKPLSANLHRLSITVDQSFMDELAEVRRALSHKFPRGGCEEIIREGFRLILKEAKKRRGLTDRPRARKCMNEQTATAEERQAPRPEVSSGAASTSASSANPSAMQTSRCHDERRMLATDVRKRSPIPAAVKRQVWQREEGRCTFEGPDGVRCGSGYQVEIEHLVPVAHGGRSTPANLTLLCRAHNQYRADLAFGTKWMAARRNRGSAGGTATTRQAAEPGGTAAERAPG